MARGARLLSRGWAFPRADAHYDCAMTSLPPALSDWFAAQGWQLHPHQSAMLGAAMAPATLLIAPTGGGKTLAGFLPSLAEITAAPKAGLHTLYISPHKALAADSRRNLRRGVRVSTMCSRSHGFRAPVLPRSPVRAA